MRSPSFALALLLTAGGARGFIAEHEVTSLPGFDGPLPSKHFSGYLPVGKTSGVPGFIHYWLILSENAPATDPLVYWTNGGPGGSGINSGLLTEMGQIHANEDSFVDGSDEIKVFYNPYSWSQVASTIYVSQVGGRSHQRPRAFGRNTRGRRKIMRLGPKTRTVDRPRLAAQGRRLLLLRRRRRRGGLRERRRDGGAGRLRLLCGVL